jgi:hypothetical protein
MHDQDENSLPKENPFINGDRSYTPLPERHGCVSAWLIFALIINSIIALIYLYWANRPVKIPNLSPPTLYTLTILLILNLFFITKLLNWRKAGFYGICATTLIALVINLCIGISPIACILGLLGIPFIYCIFQIKRNGRSAWSYLK